MREENQEVIPEILIIGAGIAGMQAALDIGDKGFKVHLVEKEPCIGGHMAQLDKTFPTLDCSSCISTPKMVDVGNTPVIITNHMDWSSDQDKADRSALLKEIEQWRSDWSSLNTDSYLNHYANDFFSGIFNRDTWSAQKRLVNSGKSWVKVNVSDISIFPYPTQPNMVVVNFEQDYSSNNLVNRMKKRQYWMKRDNRWQIVYEGAAS